jgi:hypothetical protein
MEKKPKGGYVFPIAMAVIALAVGLLYIFNPKGDGLGLVALLPIVLGVGNAIRNKVLFKVWFTESSGGK